MNYRKYREIRSLSLFHFSPSFLSPSSFPLFFSGGRKTRRKFYYATKQNSSLGSRVKRNSVVIARRNRFSRQTREKKKEREKTGKEKKKIQTARYFSPFCINRCIRTRCLTTSFRENSFARTERVPVRKLSISRRSTSLKNFPIYATLDSRHLE